jgi:outer membrane protein assembly factor BamB
VAPLPTAPDSWFLTAFDARTGRQVWSQLVGSGLGYNNTYAPVSLGPDGAAYVGTLGGLVRISDS